MGGRDRGARVPELNGDGDGIVNVAGPPMDSLSIICGWVDG